MTNTRHIPTYQEAAYLRLEDQMTSYELLAADRSAAIQRQAAERAHRAAQLDPTFRRPAAEASPRRLRLRLGFSRPA